MQEPSALKCLLIYEDDAEIALLCKTILMNDYRVETKAQCENVLADIELYKPDLILMDLWIPIIGGEKAIIIIKQNEATNTIPILLFSANADIEEISVRINADGYIEKPFDVNMLRDKIAAHI